MLIINLVLGDDILTFLHRKHIKNNNKHLIFHYEFDEKIKHLITHIFIML